MLRRTIQVAVAAVLLCAVGAAVARRLGGLSGSWREAVGLGRPGIVHNLPDPDILKEEQSRWNREVARAFQQTRLDLDQAAGRGGDVSALEPLMTQAAALAGRGKVGEARALLMAVELRIPQPPLEFTVDANGGRSAVEDLDPKIQPSASKPRRRAAKPPETR